MLVVRSLPAVLTAALVSVLVSVLAAGCLQSAPKPPAQARPTPIAGLDTASMVIPRIAFCDLIPRSAVETAIRGEVAESQDWGNGDKAATGTHDTPDVTHEFGCSWTSADGLAARAWVFARPVTRKFATQVVRQTSARESCRTPKGPPFGNPSQLQVCKLGGGVLRVRHAGLFGDSWLSCEVAAPTAGLASLRTRADAWCVEVANALDTAH